MIARYVANSMTKPGKAPVFGNPRDYGLDYEDVTFQASDGVALSGWLVKGNGDGVIIQTHFGIECSRSGYTPEGKGLVKLWPKRIEFLKGVRHLVDEGYSVLMYDLRNHGNSGTGTCPWITGGVEEYKDVIAAVNFINNHPDHRNSEVGLLSICMGAVSTAYAYGASGGLKDYKNIRALFAIQPIGFAQFLRAMKIPGFVVGRANQYNLKRGGKDLYSSCLPHVAEIAVPTLLMQNRNDPMTSLEWVEQYYDGLAVEKEMVWLDGVKKRLAAYDYYATNPETVSRFFNRHMSGHQ